MTPRPISLTLAVLRTAAAIATVATFAAASSCPAAFAEERALGSLENEFLRVVCEPETGELAIWRRGADRPFLVDGSFARDAAPVPILLGDPAFGEGRGIGILEAERCRAEVRLFPGLPFAIIRPELRNREAEPLVTERVRPLSAELDLGQPAAALRVIGTGGLRTPADSPGSYLWIAIADPQSRAGVVAGWITAERGSGVILASATASESRTVSLEARIDYGRLRTAPGASEILETLAVGSFDDVRLGLEAWADAVAKVQGIRLPPQPSGHCTWYHGGASSEKALPGLAAVAARELAPFGFSFVQIDDGWQDGDSKGNGPRKNFTAHRPDGPYPSGMTATADRLRALGLVPGIWLMPFAGTHDDPWFADRKEWFVRRPDGKPYDVPWGGTSLDLTRPEVRGYVRENVRRIVEEWGYRYLKLDGLFTGAAVEQVYVNDAYREDGMGNAVFHDPGKTNLQVLRDGLRLVREAAGPEVFILGCCAPQNMRSYGGAFGLVDAMRIGPDNGASWKGVLVGPRFGTRNWFLHGRVWYNDPDPVYVRTALSENEARVSCSWAGIAGQLTVSSDALEKLPPERLDILRRVLPAHGAVARPVDLLEEPLPRIWLVTDERRAPRRDVVAVFNWDDEAREIDCPLARIGLPAGRYAAFDFWAGALAPPFEGRLRADLPARSCAILAVRSMEGRPLVLSTSRHVTQGMVDVLEETWDAGTATLSGRSRVVGGDLYELRVLAEGTAGAWKASGAEVAEQDRTAGATVSFAQEGGLVRVAIRSGKSLEVSWRVSFATPPGS